MSQPIIKRNRIQQNVDVGSVSLVQNAAGPHPSGQCGTGEKTVRLLEEAGRVLGIEFTCSCGDITAVELLYPESEHTS
ncbi:MAG: hypothetical protein ACI8X5_003509 [Planctomycetota bacterium]|jgi:hypothetical protein